MSDVELAIELTGGVPPPGAREVEAVGSVARLLLPGAGGVRTEPAEGGGQRLLESYVPFPSWATARVLLPAQSRAAAAAAVALRAPAGRSSARRLAYLLASRAVRAGVVQRVQRSRVRLVASGPTRPTSALSLADHIAHVLGRPVLVAPSVGRPDPHRTVGMHVLGPGGELVAFAKVAGGGLPAAQVRTEARALTRLAQVPSGQIDVPRVLHHGAWNGLTLLVTSPLDLSDSHRPTLRQPPSLTLVQQVARSGPVTVGPLRDSEYWLSTRRRLDEMGAGGHPDGRAVALELVSGLQQAAGGALLQFGAWHGDFLPWNLARRGDRLLVWDWEYWSSSAPVGFDLMHYFCGTLFSRNGMDAGLALEAAHGRAGPILLAAGFPAASVDLVHALYVLEFVLRRLDIATHGGGRDDHRVFPSVVPVARQALARAGGASAPNG